MAKKKQKVEDETVDSKGTEGTEELENWADRKESKPYKQCKGFYNKILKAYDNKDEADTAIAEYWNIFNAIPDDNQMYQGNSKCYVPAIRDAIKARSKRVLKQCFPQRYKHVDAVGDGEDKPKTQLALLEHYIRTTRLKSICRSMLVSGDVTGQWNLYIDWLKDVRNIKNMVRRNPIIEQLDGEAVDPTEKEEVVEDQELVIEGPTIIDFATEDLVVIPATCNDIENADLVGIKMRLHKEDVQRMVDEGVFILPSDTTVEDFIDGKNKKEKRNPPKQAANDAGVKTEGTDKYLLIYEVTARLTFDDGERLAYIYYAGPDEIIGLIKAPQWGQKRPILSAPVDRISGSFHGISPIEAVKWLQWNLNDFWNMGQDSAMYSMLPIIMTDPAANPNYAMMVYGLAAVWPVDPRSTQFAEFPQLWKDSMEMCNSIKGQIRESMDVNDMMMGRMPAGRKNNALIGGMQQEQSVSISDHGERFEEEILTPLMERFFEYDCQFRTDEMDAMMLGELGYMAKIDKIPVQQWGQRFFFQWWGTEFVMSMQRMQQQIATMNVLRGIPPQQMNGLTLNISPILEILANNVFGVELSSKILIDNRNKFTIPPEIEDEMMINHIQIEVHEADPDIEHIQSHQKAAQASGDPLGMIRTHVEQHMMQLQKKRQMMMAGAQGGMPGVPGGAGPGVPGTPRPGAQPAPPKQPGQQPAGAIHPDNMLGAEGRG